MSNAVRRNIEVFLRDGMVTSDDPPRTATAIVCQHMEAGIATEVRSIRIGSKPRKIDGDDGLAEEFCRSARMHAEGLNGSQQYKLQLTYEKHEPERTLPFRITGAALVNKGDGETEPATNEGQRAQIMRHNEAMMRIVVGTFDKQNVMLDMALKRIEAADAEHLAAITMASDMIMKQSLREQERILELKKFERGSEDRKMIMKYAPLVLNSLAGTEVIPASAEAELILEAIEEHLTVDQMKAVAAMFQRVLPQELYAVLVNRLDKAADKRLARDKAAQAAAAAPQIQVTEKPSPAANGGVH